MEAPRPAQKGEFTEVMDFLDRVFRPGQAGRFIMQRQYPHLFQNKKGFLRRINVVRDDDELVGALGIHPVHLRLEEVNLNAGGIGQVATHPQRRGEGIMSTLLKDAIERMYRAGYAISVLGGDRQRYGWYGWENGGVNHTYSVALRYLGKPSPTERKLPLKRLQTSEGICRKLRRCTLQYPYWAERPMGQIAPLFKRSGREVWTCQLGGRFAYVVIYTRTGLRIDEMAGDAELATSMLRVLMMRRGWDQIQVVTGPNPSEINMIRPGSGSWSRSCDCMIKIINLPLLIDQLRPLLKRRAKTAGIGGSVHFVLEGADQSAFLELGKGARSTISLPPCDMVSLLFGIDPIDEVFSSLSGVETLAQLLPLPLYIPSLNHI